MALKRWLNSELGLLCLVVAAAFLVFAVYVETSPYTQMRQVGLYHFALRPWPPVTPPEPSHCDFISCPIDPTTMLGTAADLFRVLGPIFLGGLILSGALGLVSVLMQRRRHV